MGGKGGRKMSCPPEAIKESLDKFVGAFMRFVKTYLKFLKHSNEIYF